MKYLLTFIISFLLLLPQQSDAKNIVFPTVPFTSQAPYGEWKDPRFQNGCEEASVIMALAWARGTQLTLQEAKKNIIALSNFEEKKYGTFVDTSPRDTETRLFKAYFNYTATSIKTITSIRDMTNEIDKRHILLVQVDGRILKNPYYTQPGPEYHMLVVHGYDPDKKEFITNDPGTRRGKNFRYPAGRLFDALNDYPTGNHAKRKGAQKNMIVVSKK